MFSEADSAGTLTKDQESVYDRQIRLWGRGAQSRISSSKVIIFGCDPLGSEIAKNLALAGVAAIDIVDGTPFAPCEADYLVTHANEQASLTRSKAVLPSLQALNPLITLRSHDLDPLTPVTADLISGATAAVVCPPTGRVLTQDLPASLRAAGVPVVVARPCGLHGWALLDLGDTYDFEQKGAGRPAPAPAAAPAPADGQAAPGGADDGGAIALDLDDDVVGGSGPDAANGGSAVEIDVDDDGAAGENSTGGGASGGDGGTEAAYGPCSVSFPSFADVMNTARAGDAPLRGSELAWAFICAEAAAAANAVGPPEAVPAAVDAEMVKRGLDEIRAKKKGAIRSLAADLLVEGGWSIPIASTVGVLGGYVAQEVIKIVTRRDVPVQNMLTYDAWASQVAQASILMAKK